MLIELGYAVKALGWDRIVLVMNTAFAPTDKPIEALPFDMRQRRVLAYNVMEGEPKSDERKNLQKTFDFIFRDLIKSVEKNRTQARLEAIIPRAPLYEQCLEAVERVQPNAGIVTRRFWEDVLARLDALKPDFTVRANDIDEPLIQSLNQTLSIITEVAQVTETIVATHSKAAAQEMYQGFSRLLERQHPPQGFSGSSNRELDFTYFQFLGYDLFLTFISPFVRNEKWEWLRELLDIEFHIRNAPHYTQQLSNFRELSVYIELFNHRNNRLNLRQHSPQGSLIKERHENGELGVISHFSDILSADLFLFLCAQFADDRQNNIDWKPWTTIYLSRHRAIPWLSKIMKRSYAEQLIVGLGVPDIEMLKAKGIVEFANLKTIWNSSLSYDPPQFNPANIATR